MNFLFAFLILLIGIFVVVVGAPKNQNKTNQIVSNKKVESEKNSDQPKKKSEGGGVIGGIGKAARVLTTVALLLSPANGAMAVAKPEFQPIENRRLMAENSNITQQLNSTELFKSMGIPIPPTPFNTSKRSSPGGPDPHHHE